MNYQKSLSIFKKTLGGKSSTPTIYKSILNLTPTNRIRLLDIGIGDGTYLKRIINELLKAGFNVSVTGIDVCKSSLNIASKIFPNDVMINTEFENAKLNGKYDIIFMSHSFYYLKNKNRALKKILTHLSEGGLLIIILWSKKDSIYKLHNKLFTKNNKSPTLTAEDAYKLVLKNKKEFQKSKLIYFSGDVKFKKWRESTKVMRSSLEVISRIYPNSNESINLTKFKNELKNITDTGRR